MKIEQIYKLRSGLEERVAQQLNNGGVNFQYESLKISFTQPKEERFYTPDFILDNGIIVETKGQFVTSDRKKHKIIRNQFGDKYDIRFVFSNSNTRIGKKSKTTYADWCLTYGFKFAEGDIPQAWIDE
tara:strand:- start:446 stop:829 length:384 start_codon:yes stop_codon:yes gene_type:complete